MFTDSFKVSVSPDDMFYEVEGKVSWWYTLSSIGVLNASNVVFLEFKAKLAHFLVKVDTLRLPF